MTEPDKIERALEFYARGFQRYYPCDGYMNEGYQWRFKYPKVRLQSPANHA